jgi:hypothetical protein
VAQKNPASTASRGERMMIERDHQSIRLKANIRISMDSKGRALDNIFTERLRRSIKYEEVYFHSYESPGHPRQGLSRYLEFYNHERLHQSRQYRTPTEIYFSQKSDQTQSDSSILKGGQCTLKKLGFCLDFGVHYKSYRCSSKIATLPVGKSIIHCRF